MTTRTTRCAWQDCPAPAIDGPLCVGHAEMDADEQQQLADEIADETEAEITRISHS